MDYSLEQYQNAIVITTVFIFVALAIIMVLARRQNRALAEKNTSLERQLSSQGVALQRSREKGTELGKSLEAAKTERIRTANDLEEVTHVLSRPAKAVSGTDVPDDAFVALPARTTRTSDLVLVEVDKESAPANEPIKMLDTVDGIDYEDPGPCWNLPGAKLYRLSPKLGKFFAEHPELGLLVESLTPKTLLLPGPAN